MHKMQICHRIELNGQLMNQRRRRDDDPADRVEMLCGVGNGLKRTKTKTAAVGRKERGGEDNVQLEMIVRGGHADVNYCGWLAGLLDTTTTISCGCSDNLKRILHKFK